MAGPFSGRNRLEIETLIGLFINTLVLRTNLNGDLTFRELLGQVRKVVFGALTHQELPFQKLIERLQPERDPSRTPLFQVVFQLRNVPARVVETGDLRLPRRARRDRSSPGPASQRTGSRDSPTRRQSR